jgi:hypothetical protein
LSTLDNTTICRACEGLSFIEMNFEMILSIVFIRKVVNLQVYKFEKFLTSCKLFARSIMKAIKVG